MNYKNAEGYPDPTAYEALTAVAKAEKAAKYKNPTRYPNQRFGTGPGNLETSGYKPLVYICSPFADEVERNIGRAQGYCRFAVSRNCIPLAPHLHYPQFMDDDDKEQRELGLFFALVLLGKCDELWVFGDKISSGMGKEIAKAQRREMPLRWFNSRLEEVQHGT